MDEANQSRTVVSVPRPPTTKLFESILLFGVLEDGARRPPSYYGLQGYSLPSPLSDGEGLGVGLFLHKYTEMKLRRKRHQITI